MKAGDLVEPADFFSGYYHTALKARPDWVGVVTKIINENMEPGLVEVSWSHGEVLRHYTDDLRLLSNQKENNIICKKD